MAAVVHDALDLFSEAPVQFSIKGKREIPYKPENSLDGQVTTIEFHVKDAGPNTYKDLSSISLNLKVKLVKLDGTDYKDSDSSQSGVVNNFLHSIFTQCQVYWNDILISPYASHYNYKAYLETLLNYGVDASNTHLRCACWELDKGDDLDKIEGNVGFVERKNTFKNSSIVELEGRVFCDIFNINRFLINKVDVKLKFSLAKDTFFLKGTDAQTKLQFVDATLYVDHYNIDQRFLIETEKKLLTRNISYQFKRVEIKNFTIQKGVSSYNQGNVAGSLGKLPTRIIVCMVSHTAYVGSLAKNPYNFQHFNLTKFVLNYNGFPIPANGLEMDFQKDECTRAYRSLINGLGVHYSDKGNTISKEMFSRGYFIIAQDLTPDGCADGDHLSLAEQGDLVIDLHFASALTSPVTMLVYAEYDSVIEVNKTRNVLLKL
nr:TPA_asm: hexon [Ladona dragonfly adintovirus]